MPNKTQFKFPLFIKIIIQFWPPERVNLLIRNGLKVAKVTLCTKKDKKCMWKSEKSKEWKEYNVHRRYVTLTLDGAEQRSTI